MKPIGEPIGVETRVRLVGQFGDHFCGQPEGQFYWRLRSHLRVPLEDQLKDGLCDQFWDQYEGDQ